MKSDRSKWLILGAEGKLGTALVNALEATDTVVGLGRSQGDVTDSRVIAWALQSHQPDVVVNCAAWTDVDLAETRRFMAWRVNSLGAAVVARAASRTHSSPLLIHISTDYVFSGDFAERRPLVESDVTQPVSVYGESKLAGERATLNLLPHRSIVVRSGWLFGGGGDDFVSRMVRLAREGQPATVVTSQWGSPTLVDDLAHAIVAVGKNWKPSQASLGLLHLCNSGAISRFELAVQIYKLTGASPALVRPSSPLKSAREARRPEWSPMSSQRLADFGIAPLRSWKDALAEVLSTDCG